MSKLLLIEDQLEPGQQIQKSIESALGCTVFFAQNRKEALDIIQNEEIKVAIIDQRLDDGDLGTEVYKEIKKIRSDIIPIMLTSKAESAEIGEALDIGYMTYITK